MNFQEEETSIEKKSIWYWILVGLFIVSLAATIFLAGKSLITKSGQNDVYVPEVIVIEEEIKPINPIKLNSKEITMLMLGVMLLIIVGLDRSWQGQSRDTIATVVAIIIMLLGSYVEVFSRNSLAVLVSSILIVYLAAIFGKLDFSGPGGFWGVIAIWGAVFGSFGALQVYFGIETSPLIPVKEVFSLVIAKNPGYAFFSIWIYSLIIVSGMNFIIEIMGFKLRGFFRFRNKETGIVLKWDVRWVSLLVSLLMIVIPYLLTRYASLDLIWAVSIAIGISITVVAMKQRFIVGVKTNEEEFATAAAGRIMLQSQWDGIAFGIVLNTGLILLTNLYA